MNLWKGADNRKLTQFLTGLWVGPSQGRAVTGAEHRRKSVEEHARMLEAVIAGDEAAARRAMKAHIHRSKENILKSFHLKDD